MATRKNARGLRQQATEATGRATRKNDIPPHLRSSGNDTAYHPQCAALQHPKIEEADIAEALQQKYGVQPRDSETIAHLANGDFIKALETIHLNEENELFFNLFVSLMRLSYQRKIREMKQWSEQLAAMGRERQKNFLDYCQRMTRENFIYNLHRKEMNYMTLPEQNFATRFAPFVNERNVMGIMDELSEAQRHIEQNVNARMVFFDFSLKMIVLLKQ